MKTTLDQSAGKLTTTYTETRRCDNCGGMNYALERSCKMCGLTFTGTSNPRMGSYNEGVRTL